MAEAIQKAQSGDTIKLKDNIVVDALSTENNRTVYEIKAKNVTIDGGNFKITVTNSYQGTEYTGPILFGFNGDGASGTIKNLTIEVTKKGVKHAIQAYNGAELTVENVEVNGCLGYALVVNGSTVTVEGYRGLVTKDNGSGGINVDLGSGVDTPADLTIKNAKIAEENSVYVEHSHSKGVEVTATIEGGSFHSVVIAEGQTEKTKLSVELGKFRTPPTEYVLINNGTVCTVNDTTYVNTGEGITNDIGKLEDGCIITVWKGDLKLSSLPAGATVTNKGDGTVTVGSTSVGQNESYPPQPTKPTEPTKPIAGVVIGGGNQQEDEDEPEQSPSNTLRYAVICRTLNVRSGPGTEYSKLGTLSRGTLLDGELLSNGWVKFSYNGQTAYVKRHVCAERGERPAERAMRHAERALGRRHLLQQDRRAVSRHLCQAPGDPGAIGTRSATTAATAGSARITWARPRSLSFPKHSDKPAPRLRAGLLFGRRKGASAAGSWQRARTCPPPRRTGSACPPWRAPGRSWRRCG